MGYNTNNIEPCCFSSCCIKSDDMIPAFYETFKFIESHPAAPEVPPSDCVLTLKYSLLQYEDNQTKPPINMTNNTIYGKIKKVHSTFVEICYPSVEAATISYSISFENIVTLSSSSLRVYWEEYLRFMSTLPPLCKRALDSNYDLLQELHKILCNEALKTEYFIVFLPSGVLSEPYNLTDIKLVRNLVCVGKTLVFPVSQISGYVLKPVS